MSAWSEFVKAEALKRGITYKQALSNQEVKDLWKQQKAQKPKQASPKAKTPSPPKEVKKSSSPKLEPKKDVSDEGSGEVTYHDYIRKIATERGVSFTVVQRDPEIKQKWKQIKKGKPKLLTRVETPPKPTAEEVPKPKRPAPKSKGKQPKKEEPTKVVTDLNKYERTSDSEDDLPPSPEARFKVSINEFSDPEEYKSETE